MSELPQGQPNLEEARREAEALLTRINEVWNAEVDEMEKRRHASYREIYDKLADSKCDE